LVNLDRVGVDNGTPSKDSSKSRATAKPDSLGKSSSPRVLAKSAGQETSPGVPMIAGSLIASPAAVMELEASPANKKSSIAARFNFPIPELLP
jgi:hypothetical protein